MQARVRLENHVFKCWGRWDFTGARKNVPRVDSSLGSSDSPPIPSWGECQNALPKIWGTWCSFHSQKDPGAKVD